MVKKIFSQNGDVTNEIFEIINESRGDNSDVETSVFKIMNNVKQNGDEALFEYSKKFDNIELDVNTICFSEDEINEHIKKCDDKVKRSVDIAFKRVVDFHKKTMPNDIQFKDFIGVRLGQRWTPIENAGVYVPGGTASYPSSVIMNVAPAMVAGVKNIVMCVPVPGGDINPYVLYAAKLCGVKKIYKIGGAQAICAMAFGTKTISKVDVITGPGNAYVACAKKHMFGQVGIDMVAGPSEVLVVADKNNNAEHVAYDLLSQAEHDVFAQSILITDDNDFAKQVEDKIDNILKTLPRREIAKKSWDDYGLIIVIDDIKNCVDIVDKFAPEHLQLMTGVDEFLFYNISNAGSIFIGKQTPEAVGDYLAGPNHVLPTNRSARFSSGLGVLNFMKKSTFLQCDEENLTLLGNDIINLADVEGLDAHKMSVKVRLN